MSFDFWLKITCTDQVCAHVGLEPDLLYQRKLFLLVQSSLLDFANHLFVASPLQPVGQEGLHELIQDLTGDQQGRQTLERAQTQRNINRNQGRGRWEKQKKGTVKTRGAERWEVESKKERRRQTYLSEKLHVLHDKGNVEERRETVEEVELKKKRVRAVMRSEVVIRKAALSSIKGTVGRKLWITHFTHHQDFEHQVILIWRL